MYRLLCLFFVFVSGVASASTIHLSPSLKINGYRGAEMQLGLTDIWSFDAVYLNYGESWNKTNRYDERARHYRVGLQHKFERAPHNGFQAEIGVASYSGKKYSSSSVDAKESLGLSLAGAYVYQINSNIGVRSGVDYSIFSQQNTHFYSDSLLSINLGVLIRF